MSSENSNTSLWQFVKAVWQHWRLLMSGCGFVVLLGVFERFSGKNIPLEVYIGILALLVCAAFYLAWREERNTKNTIDKAVSEKDQFLSDKERTILELRQELLAEKNNQTPNLIGKFENLITADVTKEDKTIATLIICILSIKNVGKAPSIAENWRLCMRIPTKEKDLIFAPTHLETADQEQFKTMLGGLPEDDGIYNKTANIPITPGQKVTGHLSFMIPISRNEVKAIGTKFTIIFNDILNKDSSIVYSYSSGYDVKHSQYIPGIRMRLIPANDEENL